MGQIQAKKNSTVQPRLELMQRPSCLLCLEAEHVLALAGIDDFERVDIERDPALEMRYGIRIPVLRSPGSGDELDWPFDAADVTNLRNKPESRKNDPVDEPLA